MPAIDADASRQRQLNLAIAVLLSSVPALSALWTEQGPTSAALALRMEEMDEGGSRLSGDERILFLAAFDLWNGDGGATVRELLQLEPLRRQALCSLLIALGHGPDTVDSWLVVHRQGMSRVRL